MRWVFWIIIGLIAILAANFAVWNGALVAFDLWPLPFAFELPAFLAVLAPLGIGLFAGWVGCWLAHLPARQARRRLAKQNQTLETELSRVRDTAEPGRSLVA
ncbi:MAG TPA: LapA family protein [Aliidongia sp.]|nr:LapA family protein [Aliidongia sp.]